MLFRSYFKLIDAFEPEAVVSDFESWTYLYAKANGLPILSIDNMQIINRCLHSPAILAEARVDFEITRAFVKSKLPFCDQYLITTFFRPPLRKERTALYPPILRREILEAKPTAGDHLLVYQTKEGFGPLGAALQRIEKASALNAVARLDARLASCRVAADEAPLPSPLPTVGMLLPSQGGAWVGVRDEARVMTLALRNVVARLPGAPGTARQLAATMSARDAIAYLRVRFPRELGLDAATAASFAETLERVRFAPPAASAVSVDRKSVV